MEDFYPFTSADIPGLFPVGQRYLITVISWLMDWGDKQIPTAAFLLPLAIDLFDDVERIRVVKNYLKMEHGVNSDAEISEGFLHIVKAYLEEQKNGTRDVSPITDLIKSDGHLVFAKDLENFFLRYALPPVDEISVSSKYFWNQTSAQQSLENSVQLQEFFEKLREELLRRQIDQALVSGDWNRKYRKEKAMSLLLPLAIDLLSDLGRIRTLKNSFQKEFDENIQAETSDGFLKIVTAYLEENCETGNLSKLSEVLSVNGHLRMAEYLENFCLQHSHRPLDKKSIHDLQNHVILEEIFKRLHIQDKKSFRLVSPTWMEQTLPFWRRNTCIFVNVSPWGPSFTHFMDFVETKNKEMAKENQIRSDVREKAIQRFQEPPFRSVSVMYHHTKPFYSSEAEKKFWRLCCLNIENLKIETKVLKTSKLCKFILKEFCQNLKRLEIDCEKWEGGLDRDPSSSDVEKEQTEERKKDCDDATKPVPIKNIQIAESLTSLVLLNPVESIEVEIFKSILLICPNLTELEVRLWKDDRPISALLSPTLNGQVIKLNKLVIWETSFTSNDFLLLRQYTQMLANNKFDTLEHLKLRTRLANARSTPYNLYAALAIASKTLKTLELCLILTHDYKWNDNFDWIMDLSPFLFPNLTKFRLVIDFDYVRYPFGLNFDFGMLKGMPLLEKLELCLENPHREEVSRKAGIQGWLFEGNRKRYLPASPTVDYQYSAADPIFCNHLRAFTFLGWSLNEEDIRLLSGWFPNLTYLEAKINQEVFPLFLEIWPRMEKLVVYTKNLISLRKLRPLKEAKARIQIVQKFLNKNTAEVVLNVSKNGWPYFST